MKKTASPDKNDLIYTSLVELGIVKHNVIKNTENVFQNIRFIVKQVYEEIQNKLKNSGHEIEVSYSDKFKHEVELKLNDDTLIFSMHTNVFKFDADHQVWQSNYVQSDNNRSLCGMILIYNFLSDSFRYNRTLDTGYLIGRIFVNKDNHLFVEGKRQLGFLYNDFENGVCSEKLLNDIVESAIIYTLNFELLVPPYEMVKELTLQQKIEQTGTVSVQTGKRLGFRFSADSDEKFK